MSIHLKILQHLQKVVILKARAREETKARAREETKARAREETNARAREETNGIGT